MHFGAAMMTSVRGRPAPRVGAAAGSGEDGPSAGGGGVLEDVLGDELPRRASVEQLQAMVAAMPDAEVEAEAEAAAAAATVCHFSACLGSPWLRHYCVHGVRRS
jgi:hypothetical protein